VGAGSVGKFVFLGPFGGYGDIRIAFLRLSQALTQQGLGPEDLLRLRMFVADIDLRAQLEAALEELLERSRWPALTIVEAAAYSGVEQAPPMQAPLGNWQAPLTQAPLGNWHAPLTQAPLGNWHAPLTQAPAGGEQAPLILDAIAAPAARHALGRAVPTEYCGESPRSPLAVRYGPWVFVGALTGSSSTNLSPRQRIEVQSQSLFGHMEQLLHAAQARLCDVVDVGGWLTFPMSEYEPLAKVRNQLLERHRLLPASAAVQVRRVAGKDEALLSFEAIAFAPQTETDWSAAIEDNLTSSEVVRSRSLADSHRYLPSASDLARPSPLAVYYATARSAGGYTFTCGEIPRTGLDLDVTQQARDVYEQLRTYLGEHGVGPSDVVHQTVFVRNHQDIPIVQVAASTFCTSPIPTTFIGAADMGFRAGVDVEVKLIALSSRQERASGLRTPSGGRRDL
jgi:enamine deaminase RidA (YjgF/YER057c/UK114 family)